MAKAASKDEPAGMDKGQLRRHLKLARSGPIPIAFALGGDGKAIVEMDKRKPGRALEKKLKDAAPDSKTHRFGTASVDPDDPKLILLTVNRAGGGLARKLIVAFKGTGFSKVKLVLDDGTEVEGHEEEDETPIDASDDDADDADNTTDADDEPEAAAADAGDAPAAPAAAPADAGALAKDLTGLVKRMLVVVAKDPTQKAALTELATDAQASIKRGDLAQASAGIDIFREAVQDVEEAQVKGGNAPAAAPTAANGKHDPAAAQPAVGKPNGSQAQPDLAAEGKQLLGTLTHAVKQVLPMVEGIPGLGDVIRSTVAAVQSHIKAGDHDAAREGIDKVYKLAETGGSAAGASGGGPGGDGKAAGHAAGKSGKHPHAEKHAPNIDMGQKVWEATRKRLHGDVEKMQTAFDKALEGHGMFDEMSKTIRTKVEGTLKHLDDKLTKTLAAINATDDMGEREKHVKHAQTLVQNYMKHVAADPVIKMIDTNPFVPVGIQKLVSSSLNALSKSIR